MSRIDNLNKILRTLQSQTPDVDGCALVSDDGLMIASALNRDIEGRLQQLGARRDLGTLVQRIPERDRRRAARDQHSCWPPAPFGAGSSRDTCWS